MKKFLSVRGQNSSNRQRTRVVLHANCSCTIASMREDMNNVNICCQERERFVEWICKTENGDNAVTIAASKSSMTTSGRIDHCFSTIFHIVCGWIVFIFIV